MRYLTLFLILLGTIALADEKKIVGSVSTKNLTIADYPKAATISLTQATKTANDAIPGKILSVGLENEDGFLVYSIEIVGTDSSLHEINVDAGNGKILSKQNKEKQYSLKRHEDKEEEDD